MNHSAVKVYQQLKVLCVVSGTTLIPGIRIWNNLCHKSAKSYKAVSLGMRPEYTFMLQKQSPQKEKHTGVYFTT